MFKIILSTVVLVAVIGISTSAPALSPETIDTVATVYNSTFTPIANVVGGVSGLVSDGPNGAKTGADGGGKVVNNLTQSVDDTRNKGLGDQLGATVAAVGGIGPAGGAGAVVSVLSGDIGEGIAASNATANTFIALGKGLGGVFTPIVT